jgi:hypothetical protein
MNILLPNAPIASRIIKSLREVQSSNVVDMASFTAGRANAASLQESMVTPDELAEFDPAQIPYIVAQHWSSIMTETITALPAASKFADLIECAEHNYMPQGPPMSPVTQSYFCMWACFDASVGLRHETLGTIMLALGKQLQVDPNLLRLVAAMQDSAMRIYRVITPANTGIVDLYDVLSGESITAHVPSGHRGVVGELWLARVLPPGNAAVIALVMTTPYVLFRHDEADWIQYLNRALGAAKATAAKTQAALKFRIDWLEYIFAAYEGHSSGAVFLTGLPDQPATLPHYSEHHPLARFRRGKSRT